MTLIVNLTQFCRQLALAIRKLYLRYTSEQKHYTNWNEVLAAKKGNEASLWEASRPREYEQKMRAMNAKSYNRASPFFPYILLCIRSFLQSVCFPGNVPTLLKN